MTWYEAQWIVGTKNMNKGLTGLNIGEWTRETKVKNQRTPHAICFWKTQIFFGPPDT